jgi:polyisoprenoid-binding protein YceI
MQRIAHTLLFTACFLGLVASSQAAVETYKIDPVHSTVGFTIRHFFTPVPGGFTKFSGTITVYREHLENSSVTATIDVASIDTRSNMRDNDLRSSHFFDAAKFPSATFKSTTWKETGTGIFDVTGDLTIRDVTKPVVLKVKSLGFGPGMRGAMISGWEATTTINRNDFGITTYPKLLGDDVGITITVEADLQK